MTLNKASTCVWIFDNNNYTRKSSRLIKCQRLKLHTDAAIAAANMLFIQKLFFHVF